VSYFSSPFNQKKAGRSGADDSSFILTFTPNLRPSLAGVLMLGDPYLNAPAIPAQGRVIQTS
jgi:hypothetical protein